MSTAIQSAIISVNIVLCVVSVWSRFAAALAQGKTYQREHYTPVYGR